MTLSVQVNFTLIGDTATKNHSNEGKVDKNVLSVGINDTSSLRFLQAVVEKLAPTANASINYWVETRYGTLYPAPRYPSRMSCSIAHCLLVRECGSLPM